MKYLLICFLVLVGCTEKETLRAPGALEFCEAFAEYSKEVTAKVIKKQYKDDLEKYKQCKVVRESSTEEQKKFMHECWEPLDRTKWAIEELPIDFKFRCLKMQELVYVE